MTDEEAVRTVLSRIDAAWRHKRFDGLDDCFHELAVITGPGHVEYANGRAACAESYREFASNADVLAYAESGHALRLWETTAVHTFGWEMTYRREGAPKRERGTDQLVLQRENGTWRVVWRCIHFEPDQALQD